jgi:Protein of unknown function (DUF2868)
MNPEESRQVLLLHCLEQCDREERLISGAEKKQAALAAGAPLPKNIGRSEEDRFFLARARHLLARVITREPSAETWFLREVPRFPFGLVALALSFAVAAVGFSTSALGPERKINILSMPLLGILIWNLLIYGGELFRMFRGKGNAAKFSSMISNAARLWSRGWKRRQTGVDETPGSGSAILSETRNRFQTEWSRLVQPLWSGRVRALLHLLALVLAASAVGGLYVRGLDQEYRAIWESTFITDSQSLHRLLSLVLGPASHLSGTALPGAEELERIHWRSDSVAPVGANAAPWIHWYALTIGIYVLMPRLILWLVWCGRTAWQARSLPIRSVAPAYFEGLLATSTGASLPVRLVPHAFSPGPSGKEWMVRHLQQYLARPVAPHWAGTVPWGEESDVLLEPLASDEALVPVFNLTATPERESQGELHRTLLGLTSNPVRWILLDSTAFDEKNRHLADAAERHEARMAAWRTMFQDAEVELIVVPPLPQHNKF